MNVRTALERELKEVLPAEYGREIMPKEPEYEFAHLLTFWEGVAEAVNKILRRAGYGEPITNVFVDGLAGDGGMIVVFKLKGGLCVTTVVPYPLNEGDFEGVVTVAGKLFEESKKLLDRYASLYCVKLPVEAKCPGCNQESEFFCFRAPSREVAQKVVREIEEVIGNGSNLKRALGKRNCYCAYCSVEPEELFEIHEIRLVRS